MTERCAYDLTVSATKTEDATKGSAMKKVILFLSLLILCLLASCGRHTYSTPKRVVLSDEMQASRIAPPAMETNIGLSDLIAVIKITDEGTEETVPLSEDAPEENRVYVTKTLYSFDIVQVWYGETPDREELVLQLSGDKNSGCAKPHKNDELIIFLAQRSDGTYHAVDHEHSIFSINPPDDTLFAFSNRDEFTAFDGEKPAELYQAIADTAAEMELHRDEWMWKPGILFSEYDKYFG